MNKELAASLRIVKFDTRYTPIDDRRPDLGMRATDYVTTAPKGNGKFTETPVRIFDVQRMTNGMWEIIEPHYNAWKKGQEIPETGTPLAAWHGVTAEFADALKAYHVRTVEDVANITDTLIERLPPGARAIRDAAKRWVSASDTRSLATEMADKDAKIEELQRQMADLIELVGKDNTEEPIKRKPGRPKREDVEEAA